MTTGLGQSIKLEAQGWKIFNEDYNRIIPWMTKLINKRNNMGQVKSNVAFLKWV